MDIYIDYSLQPGALPAPYRMNDMVLTPFWETMEDQMEIDAAPTSGNATDGSREVGAGDYRDVYQTALAAAARRQREAYERSGGLYPLSHSGVLARYLRM